MDKKILLQKYLDGELSDPEKKQIESLIEKESDTRQMLEYISSKKQRVLKQLDQLNPHGDIIIPEWEDRKPGPTKKIKPIYKVLKWAAILIIPIGIYFLTKETGEIRNQETKELTVLEQNDQSQIDPEKTTVSEIVSLDWAISPNRSWTKKQLIKLQ